MKNLTYSIFTNIQWLKIIENNNLAYYEVFFALLNFVGFCWLYFVGIKFMSLNNEPCMIRPTFIDLSCLEPN